MSTAHLSLLPVADGVYPLTFGSGGFFTESQRVSPMTFPYCFEGINNSEGV